MRNYLKIAKLVRQYSEEKVNHIVIGQWCGHEWYIIILFLLIYDLMFGIMLRFGIVPWLILVIIVFSLFMYYVRTRRVGVGITDNRIVYVKVSRIKFEAGRVYEIPIQKIRNITVKKRLSNTIVKMTFISDVGSLEKIKFMFGKSLMGNEQYRVDSVAIRDKLIEIEKIIDKGDF